MQIKPIQIGDTKYQLNELTFHDAIKISRIPEQHNEQRITAFLCAVLRNDTLPLQMTVQERYYLLMHYLDTQTDTVISNKRPYKNYMLASQQPFKTQAEFGNATCRQLTGRDAETLESLCTEIGDWFVGAMALQFHSSDVPSLPPLPAADCTDDVLTDSLKARAAVLKVLPQSKFDLFYGLYAHLQDEMSTLCRLSFDDSGFTVLGGTDDAPARFRPSAALTGLARQLDRYSAAKGWSVGGGHADDV